MLGQVIRGEHCVVKKSILFVDDEPNFLAGLRRMLREHRDEWEMFFVGGVDEALDEMAKHDFDAVVSDVRMPVKTGLDFLETLRESGASEAVPVIILTGNAESDLKRRALDLGAADLLNKPVIKEDLEARLRSVLRLKSYQDKLARQNQILEERVSERTHELEESRRDIIWRLAKAGEFRDEDTGEHVARVACCSRLLAEKAGLSDDEIDIIFLTSPLHDIGKIGVPDGILLKPGKLTKEERVFMERHCEIGAAVLTETPKGISCTSNMPHSEKLENLSDLHSMAVTICMSHHEKWDGTGYPRQLKGEDIPIAGRIVALADFYDALRSKRPYKPPYSIEETRRILKDETGSHIDPRLHDIFENIVEDFEEIRLQFQDTAESQEGTR